jgi:hypothetical protein
MEMHFWETSTAIMPLNNGDNRGNALPTPHPKSMAMFSLFAYFGQVFLQFFLLVIFKNVEDFLVVIVGNAVPVKCIIHGFGFAFDGFNSLISCNQDV